MLYINSEQFFVAIIYFNSEIFPIYGITWKYLFPLYTSLSHDKIL